MNIADMVAKIESIFLELGFRYETVGEKQYRYLVYNHCYCMITYWEEREVFIIESADDINWAANKMLEDGNLYDTDIPEDAMLQQIREDIIKYYME